MKQLLREPLVHFILIGAGLFLLFHWAGESGELQLAQVGSTSKRIVLTQGKIEHLQAGFERTQGRSPSMEELDGLIGDYIREEVYYREALALGLDRDDTVIRNRLRLKMEFISDDVAARVEPTDEQLRSYMKEHPDAFQVEQRFTFDHIYLNPERRPESLARDAAQLLKQLNQTGAQIDVSELGDTFLLDYNFAAVPQSEVAKLFGEKFATKLGELAPGRWLGPVESGYGMHLVLVSKRPEGRLPAREEVLAAVRREWFNAQRTETNEKFYQTLLKRYNVAIERPEQNAGGKKSAAVVSR
jgi:hypothetical protein